MSRTIVFLGPSLPADEARRLLPGAELRPPAAAGDVHAAVRRRPPARLALIDGFFERMAAPWHKELLHAMERGVIVYGAASMGALRAAELADFGMIGVGQVFRAFRAGRLTDDDEVAVAHLPATHGHRPVSDAMVNLRATLRRARLPRRTHDALVALGKRRFYPERSLAALVEDGRAAGLPRRELDALAGTPVVDVKAADARLLLRRIAAGAAPPPRRRGWRMARTWFWERFVELDF